MDLPTFVAIFGFVSVCWAVAALALLNKINLKLSQASFLLGEIEKHVRPRN
jgi:hypothetical protein